MKELEQLVADLVERSELRVYGKYRGVVVDNEDPARLGRLKVTVPSVFGPDVVTGWATPCAPSGGLADVGFLAVPARNAGVWVEFEEGDTEFPLWTGTYWTKDPEAGSGPPRPVGADGADLAQPAQPPTRTVLKTAKGHTLQFEDADDAETVLIREGLHGHLITLDDAGVTITDGSGNTVLLDDTGIRVTDLTGNALELTEDAVRLTAKKPLTIDAAGQQVKVVCEAFDISKG